MRRREFIKLLDGAAVTALTALPLAARAQESKSALVGILQAEPVASTVYLLDAFPDTCPKHDQDLKSAANAL
jgi:hypothetical protein